MAKDELFDVRVVKRNRRDGSSNQAEHEAFLASLPDEAEEAVETETRMESFLANTSEPTAKA